MQAQLAAAIEAETQHTEIPPAEISPVATPEPAAVPIPEAPVQVVATQLGDVAVDAGRLVELQIRLFEAEFIQSGKKLIEPIAILATTGILAIASVVVLLLAAGTGLYDLTDWPMSVCWLLAAVLGSAITGGAAWYAVELLKRPRISFEKSKEELMRNFASLSRVVKSQ